MHIHTYIYIYTHKHSYICIFICVCHIWLYCLIIPKINTFPQGIENRFLKINIFFASWQCLIHPISTEEFFVCHISLSKHSRGLNKSSRFMFWETPRKPPMRDNFA